MDIEQLEDLCKQLRLSHIPKVIQHHDFDSKEEWLFFLLKQELKGREETKRIRLFKQSKLPANRTLSSYVWHNQISLPSPTTKEELTSLSFIRQCENAVFVGTPGTGKTHLACALGTLATESGLETRFWRVSDLVSELERQWKSNTLDLFKKRFDRVKLIILDEMGYVPFTKEGAELFLIDKITRASSDECFYPGSILKSNLQKSELLTVDEPLLDYSKVDLVDMEAADFVRVTSKISGRDLVLVMKIVSDGPNNSVNDLTATRVSHLILQKINLVFDHVNKLISLASLEEERFENPKGYTAVIERWHFTVSQQHELKQLMKRWVVAYPFTNIIKKLKIMKNSREVLTFLKHDLDNYKIDWK